MVCQHDELVAGVSEQCVSTTIRVEATLMSSCRYVSASSSSGAAQASVPKCCDTYSASMRAAAPSSPTLAVRPAAVSSTLLDFRSLQQHGHETRETIQSEHSALQVRLGT